METALFLLIDGVTNGAVYGLVALSLVAVYTVTRVVNIAQGEYVTFGALSFATALSGSIPPLLPFALGGLALLTAKDFATAWRERSRLVSLVAVRMVWAGALVGISWLSTAQPSYGLAMLASLVTVTSLGPIIYRLTVEPSPHASTIVHVIVSIGVYMVMHGVAVMIWGAEPQRIAPIAAGGVALGPAFIAYQSIWIACVSALAMVMLFGLFRFTLFGQALQAAAINRLGAQLCGIPVRWAGQISFAVGAGFSALSGMLLAPLITANYDMGFVIGLKGFVGGALGGLVEYPMAILGVVSVGIFESFAAFHASALRDALVFGLVIPILLWRNYRNPPQEVDD